MLKNSQSPVAATLDRRQRSIAQSATDVPCTVVDGPSYDEAISVLKMFSKESRRERALYKAVAKATNDKIKPDDRRPALEVLIDNGGPEAVDALLQRLTFVYQNNVVADEEEKNYVFNSLQAMPHAAAERETNTDPQTRITLAEQYLADVLLPAIGRHLDRAPTLSWGLRILETVGTKEQIWTEASKVLEKFEPGYERDPSRKQQLLKFLANLEDPRVAPAILPFVSDHDETVRFLTIDTLLKHESELAREPLLQVLIDEDEESLRNKNRIAEGFCDLGWTVKGYRGQVEKALPKEFTIDGKGRIKRKKGRR